MDDERADALDDDVRRLKSEVTSLWVRIQGMAQFGEDNHSDVARLYSLLVVTWFVVAGEAAAIIALLVLWWRR